MEWSIVHSACDFWSRVDWAWATRCCYICPDCARLSPRHQATVGWPWSACRFRDTCCATPTELADCPQPSGFCRQCKIPRCAPSYQRCFDHSGVFGWQCSPETTVCSPNPRQNHRPRYLAQYPHCRRFASNRSAWSHYDPPGAHTANTNHHRGQQWWPLLYPNHGSPKACCPSTNVVDKCSQFLCWFSHCCWCRRNFAHPLSHSRHLTKEQPAWVQGCTSSHPCVL